MRRNLLWGVVLVAVALVLLLGSLDLLPAGISDLLARAWPALLVLAGLWLLLRGRVPLGGLVALMLSLVLVGGVAFAAYSARAGQQRDDQQVEIDQDIDDEITLLAVNVGTLNTDVEIISSGQDDRITGEFTGSTQSDLLVDYQEREDGLAEFTLAETQSSEFPPLEAIGRGTLRLELPVDLAVAVAFEGESGQATFNMGALDLERLNFTLANGDALVTFPAYEPRSPNALDDPGQIIVRDGDVTIFTPPGVAPRLELNRDGNNIRPQFPGEYILIDDGADGTIEKRDIEDDDIPLFYEVTAPNGEIELAITGGGDVSPDATEEADPDDT